MRYPTKLLIKLNILLSEYFRLFLRLCSLFIIFALQEPPRNPYKPLKGGVA